MRILNALDFQNILRILNDLIPKTEPNKPDAVDDLKNLMKRLNNEHYNNLYKIVNFLKKFYDCKKTNSCSQKYENIFSFYQEKLTKIADYKNHIDNNYNCQYVKVKEDINPDLINEFNELNQDEQNNLLKLAYFVLHCQFKKINPQNQTSDFSIYSKLIKEIERLG